MKEVHDDKDKITGRAMTYSHYCDKKWDSGEGAAQHPDFGSGGNAHAIPETATRCRENPAQQGTKGV